MRGAISSSINRDTSNNIIIEPNENINVKEELLFDGTSIISTNGSASFSGSLDDKSFNMPNADSIVLNSDGSFESTREYEDSTASLSSDSNGNLNIDLKFATQTSRSRFERESFSYSPRKGISDLKVDFILGENSRRVESDRVNLDYTSARRVVFETIKRDSSTIEIIPNSDAKFQESIYLDKRRIIKLVSGSSQISIDGVVDNMVVGREYQLPDIETTFDNSYQAKSISSTIKLSKGWNLIASPINEDIIDSFIFGDFEMIFIYDGGIWYKNPNSISSNLGFWIKSNQNIDVNFTGLSYLSDFDSLQEGWNLIGMGDSFDNNKSLSDYHIEAIWRYKNSNFEKIFDFSKLQLGEGIWVKKRKADVKLNISKGWNLKSPPTIDNIDNINIFKNFESIYIYQNSKWIENPSIIKSGEGFWIYSYIEQYIDFYSDSYFADVNDTDSSNWKLKGGKIEQLDSINREIWLYRDGKWLQKSDIDSILAGEGFWVK